MAALMPLLMDVAPAVISAFAVGAARGAGSEIGKGAGRGVVSIGGNIVDAAGNLINQPQPTQFASFGQPQSAGQQRMAYLAQQ